MKLEEEVVVLGVDDMGFGFNGRERLRALTAGEEGKGREEIGLCIWGLHLITASHPLAVLGQCDTGSILGGPAGPISWLALLNDLFAA